MNQDGLPGEEVGREEGRDDAIDRALLYVFQLSGKDYTKMRTALSSVVFVRALEQDGFTVALSSQPAPDAGLRAALTAQELALLRESTDPQYRRLPMPERELVSRLLGGQDAGDGGLRRELDETKRQRDRAWQNLDIAHEDIAAMLRASGLGDHARPISTHDVIRGELLPWIEAHALRPAGRPDVNEPMVPCPWCGGEGYDNVYLDDEGVSRHTICRNDVRTETIERVLAALPSPETTPAGVLDETALREAAQKAYQVLAGMDRQALNPGPDHLVKVSVEAWGDFIRPVIAALAAALGRSGSGGGRG